MNTEAEDKPTFSDRDTWHIPAVAVKFDKLDSF